MTPLRNGMLLAGVHLALVLSLGGKLLLDRATRPRAWVRAAPVDPSLPIRGRYVSLRAELPVVDAELPPLRPRPSYVKETEPWPPRWERHDVEVDLGMGPTGLQARVTGPRAKGPAFHTTNASLPESNRSLPKDQWTVVMREPLAFFIPERVPDPSIRAAGEELWVEVTLPKKGPLRPIRLAVKKNGVLTALDL
jgi:hypothetical protein